MVLRILSIALLLATACGPGVSGTFQVDGAVLEIERCTGMHQMGPRRGVDLITADERIVRGLSRGRLIGIAEYVPEETTVHVLGAECVEGELIVESEGAAFRGELRLDCASSDGTITIQGDATFSDCR